VATILVANGAPKFAKNKKGKTPYDIAVKKGVDKALQDLLQFSLRPVKKNKETNFTFKVAIVGDPGVGKTSMICQYTNNFFPNSHIQLNSNYEASVIEEIDGKTVRLILSISDDVPPTAGATDSNALDSSKSNKIPVYRGANAVFVVFDITNPVSFSNCFSYWTKQVNNHIKGTDTAKILVGNKSDISGVRKVSAEDAKQKLTKNPDDWLDLCEYIEVSAKEHGSVKQLFQHLARKLKIRSEKEDEGSSDHEDLAGSHNKE